MADRPVIVYKCDCCGRDAAELREDGTLVITHRHGSQQHTTIITLPAQSVEVGNARPGELRSLASGEIRGP